MNRNIAFFITTNKTTSLAFQKSRSHFTRLAKLNNYKCVFYQINNCQVGIIYEGNYKVEKTNESLNFIIGQNGDTQLDFDRYLIIKINKNQVFIDNDYAGSIPVYYSTRDYISISNIEPFVVLDSDTNLNDLDYSSIYGYLRYFHFIWDETAFKHINLSLPDHKLEITLNKRKVSLEYKKSIKSAIRQSFNSTKISKELYELNHHLVKRVLDPFDKIILPLSSGYDSRMIFAVINNDKVLREKLHCFTYGGKESIEVFAASQLTSTNNVHWKNIQFNYNFLNKEYLKMIYMIFGSSLHMHGMYQLEFFDQLIQDINIQSHESYCLTSGFMTGVPAGQHNSLLNINSIQVDLPKVMCSFSQSNYWSEKLLDRSFSKSEVTNANEKMNERFNSAFNLFDGEYFQKAVMFDIWTRQRNFISYYPRTLEWRCPVVSPHMNLEYINFFMSIPKKFLDDRYAVELMFKRFYPKEASAVSNSNKLNSKIGVKELSLLFRRVKNKLNLNKSIFFHEIDLDIEAVKKNKLTSFFPIFEKNKNLEKFFERFSGQEELKKLANNILINGDTQEYQRFVAIQSLAFSIYNL